MKIIAILLSILVLSTISLGLRLMLGKSSLKLNWKMCLLGNLAVLLPLIVGAISIIIPDVVVYATGSEVVTGTSEGSKGMGFMAAALSTGLATIGAGYAVGAVGSSALGAVSEDEKILGKTLIFVGLAEGIAIYGLIISILILGRL